LMPDPEIEALLGNDPEIDDVIPDVSDIPEFGELGIDITSDPQIEE
jgi:hypothetical protein